MSDSSAEITSATVEIIVLGKRRPASMLRLGEFSAFQVGEEEVLVTILARHMGPQFPEIVRLIDLEPLLSEMERRSESPEVREALAAYFAEHRRQAVEDRRKIMEQMRNQTRDSQ